MLYNYRHIFKKSVGVEVLVMGLSKLLRFIYLGTLIFQIILLIINSEKQQHKKGTVFKYMELEVDSQSLLPSRDHKMHFLCSVVAAAKLPS